MSDHKTRRFHEEWFRETDRIARSLNVEPTLLVRPSSFPPFVIELMERSYPNRLLAASADPQAILAAARLWSVV